MTTLHSALLRARENSRYTQQEVAAALGVSRAMISYWEAGTRIPNNRQISVLSQLYGVALANLLQGRLHEQTGVDLLGMMLRSSAMTAETGVAPGIEEFVSFLGRYSELAEMVSEPIRGMRQSPFIQREQMTSRNYVGRKAKEVRSYLRLGVGPLTDMDAICEMLGITLYRASLGSDLEKAPSGAFLNHPDVGFAILVNLDMTPGRRRFTVAHELAHALFHSGEERFTISLGSSSRERFADSFAGEFMMPTDGVRRLMEELGMPPRIKEAADVIRIQRFFNVSWATATVRLRRMRVIDGDTYSHLRYEVSPLDMASSLGYAIKPEEIRQDPSLWRVKRFPRPYVQMLRRAIDEKVMSASEAAEFAELSISEMNRILNRKTSRRTKKDLVVEQEFEEYEASGVI